MKAIVRIESEWVKRNNKILIDWLSFTISGIDVDDLISAFGFNEIQFAEIRGNKGYAKKYYYDGVNINFSKTSDDMADLWVELSGQGCRVFESYGWNDWIHIMQYLLSFDTCNITRLDVAYDDYVGLIDLESIVADTLAGHYVTKASSDSWDVHLSGSGTCVTIGKSKSNTSVRIYDKAAERKAQDEYDHWVRCEIQLRYHNALAFVQMLCDHQIVFPSADGVFDAISVDGMDIQHLYFGVLNNYLRYIDVDCNNDTNKWRKPCAEHWAAFAHSVTDDRVALWVNPGVEYNVLRLNHVVEHQFAGAVATYATIHGIEALINALVSKLPFLNVKYRYLIDQWKKQDCNSSSVLSLGV